MELRLTAEDRQRIAHGFEFVAMRLIAAFWVAVVLFMAVAGVYTLVG